MTPRTTRTRNLLDLTCKEVVELVNDYLEQRLPAADRAVLEQHVFTCSDCATYLEQMNSVLALARSLAEDAPAEASTRAALEVFRRWKRGTP